MVTVCIGSLRQTLAVTQSLVLACLLLSLTAAITLIGTEAAPPNAAVTLENLGGAPATLPPNKTRGSSNLKSSELSVSSDLLHVQAASWRSSKKANPFVKLAALPKNFTKRAYDQPFKLFPADTKVKLSSPYGWRQLGGRHDFHGGVDFVVPPGTTVVAPISGKILWVNRAGYRGGVVIGRSDRSYTFWHMKPAKGLKVGQQITEGSAIGKVARAGKSTHLHYALHLISNGNWKSRNDKNSLDPMFLHDKTGRI